MAYQGCLGMMLVCQQSELVGTTLHLVFCGGSWAPASCRPQTGTVGAILPGHIARAVISAVLEPCLAFEGPLVVALVHVVISQASAARFFPVELL